MATLEEGFNGNISTKWCYKSITLALQVDIYFKY